MKLRILALLLAAVLLVPLAACSGKPDDPAPVTDPASAGPSGSDTTAPEPAETAYVAHADPPGVEKTDFGGEIFTTAAYYQEGNYFRDEEIGEAFNDALYDRLRKTEEYLNMVWKHTPAEHDTVKASVRAADDDFQQVIHPDWHFVCEGYLYRIDDLPYIDLDAEWWGREQMDVLRLGRYYYLMYSDFALNQPSAVFVNCDLAEQYHIEDPYELVYSGKWTLDKFGELCRQVAHDANGNGEWDADDIMGVSTVDPSLWGSFMESCDQPLTARDKNDELVIALNTEKMQNIVEKITALVKSPGAVSKHWYSERTFDEGNTLFWLQGIDYLRGTGDFDFTTGIMPYPKYDEAQQQYRSLDRAVQNGALSSIRNPELVGAVLEYSAWESANQVIPAYYDLTLGTRYAKDEATRDMLSFIMSNSCVDAGCSYFGASGLLNHFYMIGYMCYLHESTDLQSWLKVNQRYYDADINPFYVSLDSIEAD